MVRISNTAQHFTACLNVTRNSSNIAKRPMIPPDKSDAVTLGLNEAFGVAGFEDIRDLTERPGSNRAFRIIVRGSAYLLRINTRPGDMTRHLPACRRRPVQAWPRV